MQVLILVRELGKRLIEEAGNAPKIMVRASHKPIKKS